MSANACRVVRKAGPLLLLEGGVRHLPAMQPGRLLRFDGAEAATALTLFSLDGMHVAIDTHVDGRASGGQFGRGRLRSAADVIPLGGEWDSSHADLCIPVGPNLVGRVMSGRGEMLDGGSQLPRTTPIAPLWASVPTQSERQVISEGLPTGVTAIDALTPIGLGQSMLYTGPSGTGKSSLLRDALVTSIGAAAGGPPREWATPVAHCVRCDVAPSALSNALAEIVADDASSALRRETTTIVPAASPAGDNVERDLEGYLATLAAITAAETWRNVGGHSVVALDGGLSALGRLLRRSFALVDAYRYEQHCVDAGVLLRGGEGEAELQREWALGRQPAHRVESRGVFALLLERSARLIDKRVEEGGNADAGAGAGAGGAGVGNADAGSTTCGGSLTMLIAHEDERSAVELEAAEVVEEGGAVCTDTADATVAPVGGDSDADGEWTLAQFEAVGRPAKEIARLSVIAHRGIALTTSTLAKIGVSPPVAPDAAGEAAEAVVEAAEAAAKAEAATAAARSTAAADNTANGPARGASSSSASMLEEYVFEGLSDNAHLEELKSLADGHIVLCPSLFALGQLPALDPTKSITRIGIGADTSKMAVGDRGAADEEKRVNVIKDPRPHALRLIASPARIALSAAQDHAASAATGALGDESEEAWRTRSAARLAVWRAALSQPELSPLPLADQVVLLFTAAMGHFESDLASHVTPGGGFELMSTRLSLLRGGRDAPVRCV